MGQMTKVCRNNTTRGQDKGDTVIRLHSTDVVRFNSKRIVLNSGGWRTTTTKARMNQTANEYRLGFQVFANKGVWYVGMGEKIIPFEDGIEIKRS